MTARNEDSPVMGARITTASLPPDSDPDRHTGYPPQSGGPADLTTARSLDVTPTELTAGRATKSEVRLWAIGLGLPVPARGSLPVALYDRWDREHPDRLVDRGSPRPFAFARYGWGEPR